MGRQHVEQGVKNEFTGNESAVNECAVNEIAVLDEASLAFVGRWRGLISTTNWEKGRIIHEWREALKVSNAPVQEYSDEAWSRRVGQVSSQHVGRLRRVCERFYSVRESYPGLFWSHFQAALDWSDAEMWLEGAVQSGWSVAEMRARRWETLGGAANAKPRDDEIIESEFDEDSDPTGSADMGVVRDLESESTDGSRSAAARERSRTEDESKADEQAGVPFDVEAAAYPASSPDAPVRPFADLPELPDDLADAFESFKLAILHHKLAGWQDVPREAVLQSLDALKQLAVAPAEG
ncbi:MAG TPA: hypothetical protein VG826_29895 [Pirellulales bacterium]|nr:hypothetical protein [Pirellulales bacterium]